NLTRFVSAPFTPAAALDMAGIGETAATATRFLDNVYEASHFPLEKQAQTARASRRIGLGLTGLADVLAMLGITYGSQESLRLAGEVMGTICHSAYRTSIALAREKGAFPAYQADSYLAGEFIYTLPQDIQDGIRQYGIRNSHLTAIAPTGTISLLANNISSGLEPIYDYSFMRRIRQADGRVQAVDVTDYAYDLFGRLHGKSATLPAAFIRAAEVAPEAHLDMQAVLQVHVDNSISKTINVPQTCPFDVFTSLYQSAYAKGLKGCTAFRPNPVTGQVLVSEGSEGGAIESPQCCSIEREAD
ncbi:MAG: ribonucleoside-diphosphate reductase, adenosylcobalamin-dependent, partial [Betaproteobacteria bacterium]